MIHKTAIIDSKAKISSTVEIGPYTIIGPNVEIDENVKIHSHVSIMGHTTIGKNNVCVPKYFYKVIYNPKEQKMISFLLPNVKGTKNLNEYVCTTDSLEKITGIDFFKILKDDLENKIESEIHKEFWTGMLPAKK